MIDSTTGVILLMLGLGIVFAIGDTKPRTFVVFFILLIAFIHFLGDNGIKNTVVERKITVESDSPTADDLDDNVDINNEKLSKEHS